ncbi:FAD-dependent oxidoreductase [Arthrobacter sp. 31Y]|uniref:FAD-dependent oxidoreductase n=1 Tax=Arthrobacter sp. 31Y TaxID=1115632 RepID=UPI000464E54B|nr:FAD-dependent oxidoreductase [Arthrobacter sp. 31Y]
MDAEVAVVGLGSVGSMAAWQLSMAGVSTIGFDQFGLGDPRNAASGESRGLVRSLHPRREFIPLIDRAIDLWRELQRLSGQSLYLESGALMLGKQASPRMSSLVATASQDRSGLEVLASEEIRHRYPAHLVDSTDIGVYEPKGGVLRSDLAVVAAGQLAVRYGTKLHTGHPVELIDPGPAGVRIEAGGSSYTVKKVIVTPGAWVSTLLPGIGSLVTAHRISLAWYAATNRALFTPERFPIFIRADAGAPGARNWEGDDYFGMPAIDGGSVKFARLNTLGPVQPGARIEQDIEDDIIRADSGYLRRYLTGVHDHPHRTHVAMDGFTPDGAPMIGHLPHQKDIIIATGFSGSGFRVAPAVGEILMQLATSQAVTFGAVSEFSIDRFDVGQQPSGLGPLCRTTPSA